MQKKETKKVEERLEKSQRDLDFLTQHTNATIRLGKDKRGKIVKRPNGTVGIDWIVEVTDKMQINDEPS